MSEKSAGEVLEIVSMHPGLRNRVLQNGGEPVEKSEDSLNADLQIVPHHSGARDVQTGTNHQGTSDFFKIDLGYTKVGANERSSRWSTAPAKDQSECVRVEKDMHKAVNYFRHFDKILKRHTSPDDPIHECGQDLVEAMVRNPHAVMRYADTKLHVFPFSDVAECWKCLFTDASIIAACRSLADLYESLVSSKPPTGKLRGILIDEVLHTLDVAFLLSGTPRRTRMIGKITEYLRSTLYDYKSCNGEQDIGIYKNMPRYFFPNEDPNGPNGYEDNGMNHNVSHPLITNAVGRCTVDIFEQPGVDKSTPCVLLDIAKDWKAFSGSRPWRKPENLMLLTNEGRRLVPVEIGRSYTDEGFSQKIMPFQDFMENYLLNLHPNRMGYIAQYDIFSHMMPFWDKDIETPPICLTSPPASPFKLPASILQKPHLPKPLRKIWIGPAGTISPLHQDPYYNVLCQVVGKKYIRLYDPNQTKELYPRSTEMGMDMSNTSRIPAELVEMRKIEIDDKDEFPLFSGAKYVDIVLEQGDALYIPVGWWHYVRSLTVSISVSFWWN